MVYPVVISGAQFNPKTLPAGLDLICACEYDYAHIYAGIGMPNSTQEQAQRRDVIRELLLDAPADTQQALVDELTARGLHATQSSVSRDLKDIGAIKTARGYELPQPDDAGKDAFDGVAEFIRAVLPAGANLVVIRTAIGAAQRVALALDRSDWPEMVGNIGGDDTVFVAVDSAAAQRSLIGRIERSRS
jgi:transcriptional regulator of arginine metabolism